MFDWNRDGKIDTVDHYITYQIMKKEKEKRKEREDFSYHSYEYDTYKYQDYDEKKAETTEAEKKKNSNSWLIALLIFDIVMFTFLYLVGAL